MAFFCTCSGFTVGSSAGLASRAARYASCWRDHTATYANFNLKLLPLYAVFTLRATFNSFAGNPAPLRVLACQDRTLRILNGNEVLHAVRTAAPPTCVKYLPEGHDAAGRYPEASELLYGTATGEVVQVRGVV